MKKFSVLILGLFFCLVITACGSPAEPILTNTPEETEVPTVTPTSLPPTITPTPTITLTPTETPTPTLTPTVIYPPEPQQVTFEAADGQVLQGTYFPADVSPAPMIVLMHWAAGDQSEWALIARWLQDRGLVQGMAAKSDPWLVPYFLPDNPGTVSPAVFTFTFRECEGECTRFVNDGWLVDARSAVEFASKLEGVDRDRVVAVGASIGADGAVEGCSWLNKHHEGTCLGALALSPGSYLTVPFQESAQALLEEDPPKAVWCLYGRADAAARQTCEAVSGANLIDHRRIKPHGFELFDPDLSPTAFEVLLDFLSSTLGSTQ